MSDLESKLGDYSAAPKIPLQGNHRISVGRRGDRVTVVIGDSKQFSYHWSEAMRLGYAWAREGNRAKTEKRIAELRLGQGKLCTSGQTLITVGHWVMAKAAEAKLLAGDQKKQIET